MTTKTSLFSVLITQLLFSTALYSLPAPGADFTKKVTEETKKAEEGMKAPPAPTPGRIIHSQSQASSTSTQTTENSGSTKAPVIWTDRYTDGSQKPNSTSTSGGQNSNVQTHEPSWSDMQGQHKMNNNKKKHHGGDQNQFGNVLTGDYSYTPSPFHNHSASHQMANTSYDGAPILYHKPKSMSDTGDWHKMNKNSASHKMANTSYDGAPILYHKPKSTSDAGDWHKMNKNEHHHHHDSNWR
jgi:hypothetical protein